MPGTTSVTSVEAGCASSRGDRVGSDKGVTLCRVVGFEDLAAVVAQLRNALANVVERSMRAGLLGRLADRLRVPPARQFFHARHVHRPVVQVLLDFGEVD